MACFLPPQSRTQPEIWCYLEAPWTSENRPVIYSSCSEAPSVSGLTKVTAYARRASPACLREDQPRTFQQSEAGLGYVRASRERGPTSANPKQSGSSAAPQRSLTHPKSRHPPGKPTHPSPPPRNTVASKSFSQQAHWIPARQKPLWNPTPSQAVLSAFVCF